MKHAAVALGDRAVGGDVDQFRSPLAAKKVLEKATLKRPQPTLAPQASTVRCSFSNRSFHSLLDRTIAAVEASVRVLQ
jgi:hypothetical protein